jgi:hypothetical protein
MKIFVKRYFCFLRPFVQSLSRSCGVVQWFGKNPHLLLNANREMCSRDASGGGRSAGFRALAFVSIASCCPAWLGWRGISTWPSPKLLLIGEEIVKSYPKRPSVFCNSSANTGRVSPASL